MVTVSHEVTAETEARLRGVYCRSTVDWLPGRWSFVEGDDAISRDDRIAEICDEGQLSALCPAGGVASEQFGVFRVVLPAGADDSGFVGWLTTRIKTVTGSGVFVICGQNRERGGIFDFYGVPTPAIDSVRVLLARLAGNDSLNGVVMRVVATAPNARVGPETIFCFDQDGDTITARYGGGAIRDGWLAGTVDEGTTSIRAHYLQIEVDGTIDRGSSTCEIVRLSDGRWRLTEHFGWTTRGGGGANVLEQVERSA